MYSGLPWLTSDCYATVKIISLFAVLSFHGSYFKENGFAQ